MVSTACCLGSPTNTELSVFVLAGMKDAGGFRKNARVPELGKEMHSVLNSNGETVMELWENAGSLGEDAVVIPLGGRDRRACLSSNRRRRVIDMMRGFSALEAVRGACCFEACQSLARELRENPELVGGSMDTHVWSEACERLLRYHAMGYCKHEPEVSLLDYVFLTPGVHWHFDKDS